MKNSLRFKKWFIDIFAIENVTGRKTATNNSFFIWWWCKYIHIFCKLIKSRFFSSHGCLTKWWAWPCLFEIKYKVANSWRLKKGGEEDCLFFSLRVLQSGSRTWRRRIDFVGKIRGILRIRHCWLIWILAHRTNRSFRPENGNNKKY